jgi:hypothetical protein
MRLRKQAIQLARSITFKESIKRAKRMRLAIFLHAALSWAYQIHQVGNLLKCIDIERKFAVPNAWMLQIHGIARLNDMRPFEKNRFVQRRFVQNFLLLVHTIFI